MLLGGGAWESCVKLRPGRRSKAKKWSRRHGGEGGQQLEGGKLLRMVVREAEGRYKASKLLWRLLGEAGRHCRAEMLL